jgi:hypothetical protein
MRMYPLLLPWCQRPKTIRTYDMIRIDIDASDIQRFIQEFRHLSDEVKRAGRDALNEVGDEMTTRTVRELALNTGIGPHHAWQFVKRTRATLRNLLYEVRLNNELIEQEGRGAPLERTFEERISNTFKEGILVRVMTAEDNAVCEICQDIAEQGPYSLEEIRKLKARHPHFLSTALNCRCKLSPAKFTRRLPVTMKEGKATFDVDAAQKQLTQAVLDRVREILRRRRR